MYNIFIDGQEGTTGLKISDHLEARGDLNLMKIPPEKRKDRDTKKAFLNDADLVILCLPDQVAVESVQLVSNQKTRIIDASTAFRTDDHWVYGLPEMSSRQRETIRNSRFVSNPGCYPTGFILALKPLIDKGFVSCDYPVTVHALSGYSGGGKKLINTYEDQEHTDSSVLSSRPYSFSLVHKHVPEMQKYSHLSYPPVFTPSVGNFYHGMLVNIPLFTHLFSRKADADDIRMLLQETYQNESFVKVMPSSTEVYLENGFLSPLGCNNTNSVEIFVSGHNDQILLTARLDNLGKGASGAAVQNLNIMLGFEEERTLKSSLSH